MHLPSSWTVKSKLRVYVHPPGINGDYLWSQKQRYDAFCIEQVSQGAKKPLGEGTLIFDEVKIIDELVWNSRSESFVGVAMSKEDCCQVRDVFLQVQGIALTSSCTMCVTVHVARSLCKL